MTLRLLSKQEIVQKQNIDKKMAMDEGRNLAKQVHSLRTIRSEEEKSLSDFRTSTVSEIGKEINKVVEKRDALKGEVEILEERKRLALEPLDTQKQVLDELQETLNELQSTLEDKNISLSMKEDTITASEKTLAEEYARLESDYANFNTARNDFVELRDNWEIEAQNKMEEIVADTARANELKVSLENRDKIMTKREKDVLKAEEKNTKDNMKLQNDLAKLADRQSMLQRALDSKKVVLVSKRKKI